MVELDKNPMYKNVYQEKFVTAASFLVTEDCNLACKYCYEITDHHKVMMSEETVVASLIFLFEEAKRGNINEVSVMLFGGEPTTVPKVLERVFFHGIRLQKEYGIKFKSNMVTNAVSFPDELFELFEYYLDKVDFDVQLSVDGTEKVQNKYRVTKTGGPSFKFVEKNIWRYKELFKNCPDRLSIHGCLNKFSLPFLFESYKFFRENWGMSRIWFIPVCEEEWDDIDIRIYDENMGKIFNYILSVMKEQDSIHEIYNYAPIDRCLGNRNGFGKPCGAGDNYVTINSSGEIYPCHQVYFADKEKTTLMGDVFEGYGQDKSRIWREYSSSDLSCPSTCDHYDCYRCLAVNWNISKSPFTQRLDSYCTLMKIDQKYQKLMKKELIQMGLINNTESGNTQNKDCLCNLRSDENMAFPEEAPVNSLDDFEKFKQTMSSAMIELLASINRLERKIDSGKDQ